MTFYPFNVGRIRCTVVPDGGQKMPLPELAGLFPSEPEIQTGIMALAEAQDFFRNCLLIESEGQLILIDTGLGMVDPDETPHLLTNLQEAGIAPEAIDIVVITHGHADHMGGGVDDTGQRTFPKARYLMTRLDWDYWTGPALRSFSERCLLPLRDHITLIEPDASIAPGIRALPALGHTPGHIGIIVESQGEQLIYMADAMHHPIQIAHPSWSPHFDTDPAVAAQTRRTLLVQAAAHGCAMAYHFGFPGLGVIGMEKDNFIWNVID